ncbi:MAG TPA: hypothetical protein VMV92_10265 [Streptosporangiaceae bacterium]|nr:hypothetical protein [Streptosporangiaceae bacterium]
MSAHMSTEQQADAMGRLSRGATPIATRGPLLADLMEARYEAGMTRAAFNVIQILAGRHTGGDVLDSQELLHEVAEYCGLIIGMSMPPETIFGELTQ